MSHSRTKQVCTIGPASAERIPELVAAGMDVARVNFSHGTPDEHRAYVHAVRAAAHSARRSVAVMVDLPGAKLRLGDLIDGQQVLVTGAPFTLKTGEARVEPTADVSLEPTPEVPPEVASEGTPEPTTDVSAEVAAEGTPAPTPEPTGEPTPEPMAETTPEPTPEPTAEATPEPTPEDSVDDTAGHAAEVTAEHPVEAAAGDASWASVPNSMLASQLQVGDRVLLADGAVELIVTAIEGGDIRTEVVFGGLVRSRAGVNITSQRFTGNGLTEDDRAALPRALELRADLIAQSFVHSAADVNALRALLPVDGPRLVAKIETRSAIDDFDAICAAADGIMIARGDMGVDLPFEQVPLIQKDLVRRATAAGKFTIVATQMLESMTAAARPTRAEASDVANAVLDGADAVMLSAETAIGAFPLEALQAMERICMAAEGRDLHPPAGAKESAGAPAASAGAEALIVAAARLADMDATVDAIWCFTRSGRTAELLSLQRPRVPIAAFTLSPIVARRLAVRGGVVPLILSTGGRQEPQTLLQRMESAWHARRALGEAHTVMLVTTSSQPSGINRLELHHLATARR